MGSMMDYQDCRWLQVHALCLNQSSLTCWKGQRSGVEMFDATQAMTKILT